MTFSAGHSKPSIYNTVIQMLMTTLLEYFDTIIQVFQLLSKWSRRFQPCIDIETTHMHVYTTVMNSIRHFPLVIFCHFHFHFHRNLVV